MAGAFTTYTQQKVLDHVRGKTSWTMPTTVACALFTATPSDAGGGTEATYTGYLRATVAAADWTAASGTSSTNTNPVSFPLCSGGSNSIGWFGLYDSATVGAGNLLAWGAVSSALTVSTGITPSFAASQLTITLD